LRRLHLGRASHGMNTTEAYGTAGVGILRRFDDRLLWAVEGEK
jgi:hypothetical protein